MPSVPLAISSQSRNKLHAFAFVDHPVDGEGGDKDKIGVGASANVSVATSQNPRNEEPAESSPQLPPLPSEKRPCPRTPAAPIPLAELIGNTEDVFDWGSKAETPEDDIYWHHGPTPQSSIPSATTKSSRRGKKRARSSSPSKSSPNQQSAHFQTGHPLDLKTLHDSLKTPRNDPALDLWARYTHASIAKKDANGKALPTFAHLMTSSPHTPNTTNGRDSGLRRSISCGIEWPVSKGKRRKLNPEMIEGRVTDVFAESKTDIMGPGKSKASRITLLMEKLQENSLKVPQLDASGPSSSSPLPNRIGLPPRPDLSPIARRLGFSQDHEIRLPRQKDKGLGLDTAVQPQDEADSVSSEFGDEDMGLDILEAVEEAACTQAATATFESQGLNSIQPATGTASRTAEDKKSGRATDGEDSSASDPGICDLKPAAQIEECPELTGGGKGDPSEGDIEDEFGGVNDDTTAMADLAALFDSQEIERPLEPPAQTEQKLLQQASGNASLTTAAPKANIDDDAYEDDDDIWDEIGDGSALLQQTSNLAGSGRKHSHNRAIKRYLIIDVAECQYVNAKGRQQPEKMLSVKDEKTGMRKIILLRQAWLDSRCTKGSYVHLIGDFDRLGQCIVDDHENMIILHPDHLISATVVADSFSCTRRAVLQDRIKATGAAEPPQVYGHILHEIFGQALQANDWSAKSLQSIIEKILENWVETLYEINTPVPQAADYLMGKMPELQAWASIFVNADAHPQGEVRDRNGGLSKMNVNKLLQVEEHIWSPMFGLKGNVDATVQITLQEPEELRTQTLTVPLEFKTGKRDNNEMHRAQTALYTLLLSDRYDVNVTCGVLYYLETSKTFRVQAIRNELRHMIIQRNELACYVRNKLELPPLIKKPFLCNSCYAQTACFTYHKLIDDGNGETSGLKEKFDDAVKHLKPVHQAFFQKWDELLTKEERNAMKFRRELWTMLSDEREALGRCFGKVFIEPGSAIESPDGPKINRYQYSFKKQAPKAGFSFTESQLMVGEPIVVSDEKGHFALANGYITKVRPDRLTVAVGRKLDGMRTKRPGFDPHTNQIFHGIMEVEREGSPSLPSPYSQDGEPMLFRVDKDEFSNGMATVRNNLIRMMEKDLYKARELRQLIVEGATPAFGASATAYSITGPLSQQNLNVDQVKAIDKVMSAKDYALVLGMPGTGKTTTIAHIIRALVSQGKSVLLTSYTHTAVDNILLKIKDDQIPILRLGAVAKVHPEVQAFADLAGISKKTFAELEESYVSSQVVASTCLGVNHAIFNTRIFDYCIVDEASQITLPTCLGPIRMAKTFILVGDHFQLPPLVQNKEAQAGGLDISLFKMLCDAHPAAVVNLEHQYRMAEDIMSLSNALVYNGRLKCATSSVATRTLSIPNLEAGLAAHHFQPSSSSSSTSSPLQSPPTSICLNNSPACWLRRALTPASRVLFLNTEPLLPHSLEKSSTTSAPNNNAGGGRRITNTLEATLTTQLVATLLSSGVPASAIGIITFYRSQLSLLRQSINSIRPPHRDHTQYDRPTEIEMHTADKFQGRDKEIIILSCVRSNEAKCAGELLRDWRRVNVALTRARSKLLIVGSKQTLGGCGEKTLEGLINLVDGKGWVVDLPVGIGLEGGGVGGHVFESGVWTAEGGGVGGGGAAVGQGQGQGQSPTENVATADQGQNKKRRRLDGQVEVLSPSKKNAKKVKMKMKQPTKLVNGAWAQAEQIWGRSGIMQDIINGI